MARVPVLINRHGGAASQDPKIAETVAKALREAGIDAEVEAIDGGKCAVRCAAIAERGDNLVIVVGGEGGISAAASAFVATFNTGTRCNNATSSAPGRLSQRREWKTEADNFT